MDQDAHPWFGRRVWVIDAEGKRHHGTVLWSDGVILQVRIDTPDLAVVPIAARGERWGFIGGVSGSAARKEPAGE